jgi:hypothetical protein
MSAIEIEGHDASFRMRMTGEMRFREKENAGYLPQ